jgi:pentapeptide repeat protein
VERAHQGMAEDDEPGRKPDLRSPAILAAIGVVATLVLASVVVMALLQTGDAKAISGNAAVIGVLLALGGVFTTQLVNSALEDRRAREAHDIEATRAQETRRIETMRAEVSALRRYFEHMGKLLADPDRPLHRTMLGDDARTEARAHTLLILQYIEDPVRKRNLVEFLHQSRLIHSELPVVDLRGANLDEADLSHAHLSHANLSHASLHEADLNLAILNHANLSQAFPIEANLSYAVLRKTNLSGAALHEANLCGAHLEGADLRDARGVTEEELEKQAENLEGTIMPDGSKHP